MTKRGILSIVSSVYDPLGIVSPFVLTGRSILQNICKQGIEWDEEIGETDLKKWNNWLNQLDDLHRVKIERCYKPREFGKVVSCQLHCFSDASDIGLGMAFYFRLVDDNGKMHCSFVLGKSRVAPLKTITVPRMGLTAAARTVSLSKVILEELDYSIDKVYFWTDSMTVLRYIFNRNARYHTFVANRLAVIHEATDNDQWNCVNTKLNPADLASRGMNVLKFLQSPQWFRGPDFLWLPEDDWPKLSKNLDILENDSEVKHVVNVATCTTNNECQIIEKLISRYSNINKLRRILAWMLKAIQSLKRIVQRKRGQVCKNKESSENIQKKQNGSLRLQIQDVHNGEKALIHCIQHQHFDGEFQKLSSKSVVKRSYKLCKLDPFIDEEGILRVGGRLRRANLSDETKHPVILPKDSRISYMIILDIHKKICHLGKNSILARLREKYWIIGANTIVKSIVSKCVICRKYQAPIMHPKMADLPSDRVTPDVAPFKVVGIDYFGPFEIKQRRCTVKRYGVIFTCLKVRAVHLEIANSLDTDSCINAIRRFISRRGMPEVIRSDNGTNFVGAERELREELDKWNQTQLNNFMLQRNIDWKFNPPAASNFGGVWERLIRSVRKVLYSIIHEQNVRLDDENLRTLFCEVEAILNGRPITTVSDDVNDLTVLTPNDLLLLRNEQSFPPGTFVKTDNYVKRRWRQVQYLANLFWHRWTKEYLPILQQRAKWNKTERNLQVGDLVLIVDNTPRNSWKIGRVLEVIKDKLGAVRIAKVKTPTTVLQRSIGKLCLVMETDMDNV